MLVGYGAGATLNYAMLAQAPAETFAGGVSIDFCPALRLRKRLCEANALHVVPVSKDRSRLVPDKARSTVDRVTDARRGACRAAEAQRFVQGAPGSEIVLVSRTGNLRTGKPRSRQPCSDSTRRRDHERLPPAELAGLPIVEVPAKQPGDALAILISGDGGWAGIDKAVAASLAEQGIAVVGVDSLRYFWKERTPQSAADDVDRIVRHYMDEWDRKDVVLIGYSQGADVLPFVVNRLPAQTRARVRLAAMLGLGERAVFEFRLANWLSPSDDDGLPIAPELQRMSDVRGLCVYSD